MPAFDSLHLRRNALAERQESTELTGVAQCFGTMVDEAICAVVLAQPILGLERRLVFNRFFQDASQFRRIIRMNALDPTLAQDAIERASGDT
jgi:hypothetical protein